MSYTATLGPGPIGLHRARKGLHFRLGEASGDIMDVLGDWAVSRFLIALPRLAFEVGDDGSLRRTAPVAFLGIQGVPKEIDPHWSVRYC